MKHRLLLLLTLLCGVLSGAKGINHALEVTTSEPQANIWDWQMHYKLDAPLIVGKNYVFKARIKGSANGTLALWPIDTASDNKNQWGGSNDVQYEASYDFTTSWKTFTWNFSAKFPLNELDFVFGQYGGSFFFDDVTLKEEGSDTELIVNGDFEGELTANWEKISWQGGVSFKVVSTSYKGDLLQAIKDAKAALEAGADLTREEAIAALKALEEAIAAAEAFTTENDEEYLAEAEKLKKATANLTQWIGVPDSADPNFQIYLCFGQSNMEGNAAIEAQDKTGVNPRFLAMYTLDNAQAGWTMGLWHTAVPPQARPGTRLSVVDYFGRKMVENLPEEVKVGTITVAVGGASIDLFDKDKYQSYLNDANTPDWLRNYAKEYGGNPYARLIELAKMAQQKGVIKGILLHQGETNNCDQTWPSKVKKIYEDILADLGLDAKNVPLLVGELGQKDQGAACWGHNAIIDNITATIPTAHVVSSKGCPLQSDKLHFTAEGYRMFGKRYADVMLELLGVVPVENRNYYIRYESTVGENLWDRQAIYTLPKALEKDAKYMLTMKVRTSADCAELGFWPIWNASDHKNQWGGSDDVQYLAAYHIEAGDWKTLTWNFTANFTLDTFQFVFGKYGGTLDIDDMVLVKEGTSENLIANADFSARNIQGWSTNWNGPSYSLANDAYASTGIEKPAVATMMKSADKAYYTLQGVKVIRPTKGIYIHGGKKILIKE